MVQEDNNPVAEQRHHEIVEKLEENAIELRALNNHIVSILANKVPEGYLPLDVHRHAMDQLSEINKQTVAQLMETHKEQTKSLNRSWTWVLLAALAIVKFAPSIENTIAAKVLSTPTAIAKADQ